MFTNRLLDFVTKFLAGLLCAACVVGMYGTARMLFHGLQIKPQPIHIQPAHVKRKPTLT